jgi:hypothetical protein
MIKKISADSVCSVLCFVDDLEKLLCNLKKKIAEIIENVIV